MADILKINGTSFASTPTPIVEILETIEYREGFGTPLLKKVVWNISGMIVGSDCLTTLASIISQLASAATNSKFEYTNGSIAYATLDGSLTSCVNGVNISALTYPPTIGRERKTMLHYSFSVSAEFAIGTSWKTINRAVTYDMQGMPTISYSGRYCDPTSTTIEADCKTWARSIIPAPAQGVSRSVISERYSENMSATSTYGKVCDYEIVEKELWSTLEAGIASAEYSMRMNSSGPGPQIATFSGRWVGKDRNNTALYNAFLSAVAPYNNRNKFSNSYNYDPVAGTIETSFSFLNDGRTIVLQTEEISYEYALLDFVMLSVLNEGLPIRQNTVKRPCTISQRGKIVSQQTNPVPVNPIYPNSIKNKRVTRSTIDDIDSNAVLYQVDYEYTFILASNP
jgi:hypothetical protein